jgi:predicted nucleic acid-binding protein
MSERILVLDTSVFIKWYRQHEEQAAEALALRDAYLAGDILLVEPDVAVYEFANVMRYMGELATEQVQLAVDALLALPIRWLKPDADLMARTVAMARTYDTTVYDTVFAALAQAVGGLYVTADMRFVRRTSGLDFVRPLAGFQVV